MQLSTIVAGAAALFSATTSASPVEARATSVNINPFALSCTATQCTWTLNYTLIPENTGAACSFVTSGGTIPTTIGTAIGPFACSPSDPNVRVRIQVVSGQYRLLISQVGSPTSNFDYFLPSSDFPGGNSYTGPSSFVAL
ncbi:predicted protein [Chaetomium globosum CBS 148.51]|uniref:Uncharacterized protein n=1 Tax=Chaetomium globosum (strain ATCC 6205 / CBS 148.51 / DSM 1962 / NBRC 6347 / NRRL 1970) TaxID=306901 RepID=Q2H843_CHAGB|nr:uncharacterized protein CHGG_03611 [Chaetomium globosum CBS 148.51]EAQ91676.1 predicted protein [Chaetomium globosum CBS 148.51]